MTDGLIDDEQKGFRSSRGFGDQIFTLKWVKKTLKMKRCMQAVCTWEVNSEELWHIMRMWVVNY